MYTAGYFYKGRQFSYFTMNATGTFHAVNKFFEVSTVLVLSMKKAKKRTLLFEFFSPSTRN